MSTNIDKYVYKYVCLFVYQSVFFPFCSNLKFCLYREWQWRVQEFQTRGAGPRRGRIIGVWRLF